MNPERVAQLQTRGWRVSPPAPRSQAISLADALAGFTAGSAFVNHRDHESGIISPGAVADLVILDGDHFSGDDVTSTRTSTTVVGGRILTRGA